MAYSIKFILIVKNFLMLAIILSLFLMGCTKSAEDKSSEKKIDLGISPFSLKPSEITGLAQLARGGDSVAARKLAEYYYLVENDSEKGFYWNEKAAEYGFTRAQFEVGLDYLVCTKPIKRKNVIKARYYLQKAAQKGDLEAKKYLSLALSGDDIKRLRYEGEKGDSQAAYKLYQYYHYVELGNYKEELYWLNKSAQNGDVEAQYELGCILETKDKFRAIFWLKKAAINGHIKAKAKIEDIEKIR